MQRQFGIESQKLMSENARREIEREIDYKRMFQNKDSRMRRNEEQYIDRVFQPTSRRQHDINNFI